MTSSLEAHRSDRARFIGRAVARTALALALASSSIVAQPPATRRARPSPDTARLVADLFFRAVADERWTIAASMVDTTLMRFIVAQRLRWQRPPAKPQIPPQTDGGAISSEFANVNSVMELARLSALEATERYLQAQDPRVQLREASRRGGCADSAARSPVSLRRITGVAMASDTVAYVVHEDASPRDETDLLPRAEAMVMQLRLRGAQWTIIPGSALLRVPGALSATAQCRTPQRPSP